MLIRTARWADQKAVMESGLVPVGISMSTPKHPIRYAYIRYMELAPDWSWRLLEREKFERLYMQKLERLGVHHIRRHLENFARDAGKDGVVLLCYEDLTAGEWCHRTTFAAWWNAQTGEDVAELAAHLIERPQLALF